MNHMPLYVCLRFEGIHDEGEAEARPTTLFVRLLMKIWRVVNTTVHTVFRQAEWLSAHRPREIYLPELLASRKIIGASATCVSVT